MREIGRLLAREAECRCFRCFDEVQGDAENEEVAAKEGRPSLANGFVRREGEESLGLRRRESVLTEQK